MANKLKIEQITQDVVWEFKRECNDCLRLYADDVMILSIYDNGKVYLYKNGIQELGIELYIRR